MLITEHGKRLNISFDNNINQSDVILFKDLYGVHAQIGDMMLGDFPSLTKVADYLYEIEVDNYDLDYMIKSFPNQLGACSEVRNGNIIGRNYDWNYSNNCEYIVRVSAKDNRHASIGISSVNVTEAEMQSEEYNEKLKLIPFETLDGINDCGVYCGTNIVPAGDKGFTTGTNPGKDNLPNIAIVRYILDNAISAKDAVNKLKDKNIYSIEYDGQFIELHVLIADTNDTFIVEFVNNTMSIIEYKDKKAIMTNFYLTDWNGEVKAKWFGNTDEEIRATGLSDHAEGLERYLILESGIDNIESIDDAMLLMKEVEYTKAYDKSINPFWYSELVGARDLTIYNTAEEYAPVVDIFIDRFEHRDRNNPITWQTVHCSSYDIENKCLKIRVQEQDTIYSYTL